MPVPAFSLFVQARMGVRPSTQPISFFLGPARQPFILSARGDSISQPRQVPKPAI